MKQSIFPTIVTKILIGIFFFGHCMAIGIYAIPLNIDVPVLRELEKHVKPLITPYVFATAQWQRWDLFSPNPLRRIDELHVDVYKDAQWTDTVTISAETLPWWRKSVELKAMRRLYGDANKPLLEQYIRLLCEPNGIPPGTLIRGRWRSAVLPYAETHMSLEEWRQYTPVWNDKDDPITTSCPPVS